MTALTLAGTVGLGVAGCGAPGGSDGDLTNGWAPIGEPRVFTPQAGTCHPGDFAEVVHLASYVPVDCANSHRVETVHVGVFAPVVAQATALPKRDSAGFRTAYGECDNQARGYLGADWRTGRLWLGVATPSPHAWSGGARWFRCDVTELSTVEDEGDPVSRTGSLKGALRTRGPLHLGCYAATLTRTETIDRMPAVDCGTRHNSEFTGVWRAPASLRYPTAERDWAAFYDGCYQVAAEYVEVPQGSVRSRIDIMTLPGGAEDWRAGNRGVRCYLWSPRGRFTRSLAGVGTAGLPIRTG